MYDAAGRCVQLAENGGTPSYSGNAIKNFLWCGAERCEERDNSNAVVSVFSGLGQKTSGTNYFYTFDHLGSVREVTAYDGSGIVQVQSAFDFDPYGNKTVLSGTFKPDFGFTGIFQHSRTNLALTWFRQYNPSLGRWLSRDPLEEESDLNQYSYCGNNTLSFVDPLGLSHALDSMTAAVEQAIESGDPSQVEDLLNMSGNLSSQNLQKINRFIQNLPATPFSLRQAYLNKVASSSVTNRGKLGSAQTKKQVCDIGSFFLNVIGGGGQASEERIKAKKDGGQKGSVFPDITAEDPSGLRTRVQTIDTLKSGMPTRRERTNALKIMRRTSGSGSILINIPKQ